MRSGIVMLIGIGVLGATLDASAAGTARDAYQKRVAKVASPAEGKGKTLCFCSDTQAITLDRVGFVRQSVVNNQVSVACVGDTFDAAGAKINEFSCPVFLPLVK